MSVAGLELESKLLGWCFDAFFSLEIFSSCDTGMSLFNSTTIFVGILQSNADRQSWTLGVCLAVWPGSRECSWNGLCAESGDNN